MHRPTCSPTCSPSACQIGLPDQGTREPGPVSAAVRASHRVVAHRSEEPQWPVTGPGQIDRLPDPEQRPSNAAQLRSGTRFEACTGRRPVMQMHGRNSRMQIRRCYRTVYMYRY